ncbi:hypothetical protein glysoja_025456 [Glycine soja]|uniref:Glyoxal oxidase N-terminal domain-containing protein n=1 Tax=Glycine soja TaxID=3848 RepID=A0A0B2RAF1_GLYSO|nr:hypothetical protein glysoja_025456 [Glycine soja]
MTLQEGSTSTGGHWVQLQRSIGISAMHMQVISSPTAKSSSAAAAAALFWFLRFLKLTRDPNSGEENNLYPFLHLLPDGNLFIFANRNSILFDYTKNKILRNFPLIPGQEKRNYPSTASSVLLPLNLTGLTNGQTRLPEAEVMICGGAYPGAYSLANKLRIFLEASRTCGRLKVTDENPEWVMEVMPMPRVMPDMILLPTGDLIILNGAMNGSAGWENAVNPVLHPVMYKPGSADPFKLLAPASTGRLYHSSAVLVPDGRVLVGGSNPHRVYDFRANPYPTELSMDAYYPEYLGVEFENLKPSILTVEAENNTASYGRLFAVTFELKEYRGGEVRLQGGGAWAPLARGGTTGVLYAFYSARGSSQRCGLGSG